MRVYNRDTKSIEDVLVIAASEEDCTFDYIDGNIDTNWDEGKPYECELTGAEIQKMRAINEKVAQIKSVQKALDQLTKEFYSLTDEENDYLIEM